MRCLRSIISRKDGYNAKIACSFMKGVINMFGPLNTRLPRYLQFSWEEGSRLFKRKKKERSEMTEKEKERSKREGEKLLKRLKLKD